MVGPLLIFSIAAQTKPGATPAAGKKDDAGLPLLGPPAPTKLVHQDGSTTTTSQWGRGTKAETVNKNGKLVSTVYTTPAYDGGQTTKVEAGTVNIITESDSHGVVRRLEKTDSSTLTKNVFEYDEKGQLVKASVFKSPAMGEKEEPQEIYETQNTASGSPERYNKETNKFERIPKSDWEDILDRLNKTESEIKEVRNRLTPDELEKERMEAARHPMGEHDEPPTIPGSEGSAAPLTKPKPREGLALPSNPLDIDPCLIGTWEATSFVQTSTVGIKGGAGFRVTFTRDHRGLIETIDYSKMQPLIAGDDPDPIQYRGSAKAWIRAKDGMASVEKMENTGVTMSYRKFEPMRFPNLGPGGLGTVKGSSQYVCSGDTLEYQASGAADGHANVKIKLTRVK